MMNTIFFLRECPEWAERAAAFFAPHWNDPIDEFRRDIARCIAFPDDLSQYYIAVQDNTPIPHIHVSIKRTYNGLTPFASTPNTAPAEAIFAPNSCISRKKVVPLQSQNE